MFTILSITLVGCGTRKATISKFLEVAEIDRSVTTKEKSRTEATSTENSTKENMEENTETTTVKEYAIAPDGMPYLAKETTTNKKGSKAEKEAVSKSANTTATTNKEVSENDNSSYKVKTVDKQTEADKTVAKNMGGWGVMVIGIIILAVLIYFARK